MDLYNANSIDRLPSKTKIRKDSWSFDNSLWRKSDFSSTGKNWLFLLKKNKNNHSSASDWWEYTKSSLKVNARVFLPLKKILEFQDWKKDYETYTKKKISN